MGGGDGGGFITTAAYGSPLEPHVKLLRQFRDRFVLTDALVRSFVRLYYTYSPPMAKFISGHESLRRVVRWRLLPLVGISWSFLRSGFFFKSGIYNSDVGSNNNWFYILRTIQRKGIINKIT